MASGKSNYAAKATLDAWYGSTTLGPASVYFGLWTSALSASSTGSSSGECSYTGYARVAVTNNSSNFPNATGSTTATKTNANAITFGQNTGGASQTVVAGATCTASTAGNIINWGDITSTVINVNDTPQIAASGFTDVAS